MSKKKMIEVYVKLLHEYEAVRVALINETAINYNVELQKLENEISQWKCRWIRALNEVEL